MPSTIVKLCSSDARAWAHNQPVWLQEDGEVARPVTRSEQQAISRALERTRTMQQSFRMALPLLDAPEQRKRHANDSRAFHPSVDARRAQLGGKKPAVPTLDCAFEVEIYGGKRVVTVFNGTNRYATGREVLAARLLSDHGECVLHGRNGKCIAVLRDPLINQRAPMEGRRVQFSRNPADALAEQQMLRRGVSPLKKSQQRPVPAQNTVYSPDKCPNDCRGYRGGGAWALAENAPQPSEREHHPVCKFARAWAETLEPDGDHPRYVLYDLELATVTRAAEPSEVAEADDTEKRTSIRQITVQNRLYAVLPEEEAIQAAREARGDDGSEALTTTSIHPSGAHPALLDHDEPEVEAQPVDRQEWPLFEEHSTLQRAKPRTDVTPKDYLARSAPGDVPVVGQPGSHK